jgi:hypothetical protein
VPTICLRSYVPAAAGKRAGSTGREAVQVSIDRSVMVAVHNNHVQPVPPEDWFTLPNAGLHGRVANRHFLEAREREAVCGRQHRRSGRHRKIHGLVGTIAAVGGDFLGAVNPAFRNCRLRFLLKGTVQKRPGRLPHISAIVSGRYC